jgi:NMD protein affecting ribosome stability and mRNA decay
MFMITCNQCGSDMESLMVGVCMDCCRINQELLDTHNAEYDYWNSLTESQKIDAIAFAK